MHPIGENNPVRRAEVHGFEHSEDVLTGTRDRRLIHRMLFFWASLKGDDALPSIDDLDIDGLPEDWRHCFILARTGVDAGYGFDYLGRSFAEDFGAELPGSTSDIMPGGLLDHAVRALPLAVEQPVPFTTGGAFSRAGGGMKFRSILLPFEGRASHTIYLVGAANGRAAMHKNDVLVPELRCYKFDHGVWVSVDLPPGAGAANDG